MLLKDICMVNKGKMKCTKLGKISRLNCSTATLRPVIGVKITEKQENYATYVFENVLKLEKLLSFMKTLRK